MLSLPTSVVMLLSHPQPRCITVAVCHLTPKLTAAILIGRPRNINWCETPTKEPALSTVDLKVSNLSTRASVSWQLLAHPAAHTSFDKLACRPKSPFLTISTLSLCSLV